MEIELAVYEDCLNLIDKFAESSNPTFEIFCQKWQYAMFQHIYAAQTTAIEVIQTTKAIFHLAKRIITAKDDDDYRRVGGIFLIYAVYFKQPTNQYVKVLMSYETWQDILKFIDNLPDNVADEVSFIFWSLYKEDAFRFTALDYDVGLENLVDYDRLYESHIGNKMEVVRVKLKQKLKVISDTEKLLPTMAALEEQYNKTKQSLVSFNKDTKILPSTKIFQDIQDAINSIHNILEERKNSTTPKDESNSNEIRKELKRKAAGRCEHTTNEQESADEDNFQQDKTKKHFGKPTVRQLMSQKLPEFITENLKNYSEAKNDN